MNISGFSAAASSPAKALAFNAQSTAARLNASCFFILVYLTCRRLEGGAAHHGALDGSEYHTTAALARNLPGHGVSTKDHGVRFWLRPVSRGA
jgi:hypothetical protein